MLFSYSLNLNWWNGLFRLRILRRELF